MTEPQPEETMAAAQPSDILLDTYRNLDAFRDRLTTHRSNKSPSMLALQSLTHSKPDLARKIFEDAVMEPFMRLLTTEFPAPPRISDEGMRRIEDLRSKFLQQPIYVAGMLEAIFVLERIEPWAEDTVKLMSRGKLTLGEMRKRSGPFVQKIQGNGCALATMDMGQYVRERDYRIMLALITAIDGRSAEQQAVRILDDLPRLKGLWDEYGDGTTESIIGPDGARKIVGWILGYVEF
jgi:hypothetical protein